jgi:hypothetical protein
MNNKTKVTPIVLFLSAIMMLVSCQKQRAEWQGIIEEVDGVTVFKNTKEPMYGEDVISLKEELSIGEAEGREEYMFSVIRAIEIDDKEIIYVADTKGNHIREFDKNGGFLRTIGREGQGPGEFQRITNIQITSENELMVHDRYTFRLTFFSLDGDYLRTVLLKGIQAFTIKVNSMGNYLVRTIDFDSATPRAAYELKVYSSDLAFDSEGKTVRKVSKDYVPVEISKEEKKKRKLPQNNELPRYFPAFQDFSVDEENRIFVQTWERTENEEGYYFDVFDSEGKYIAKIALKFPPKVWKNNKLYTIEEDEEGYQFVKRYKVTWKY